MLNNLWYFLFSMIFVGWVSSAKASSIEQYNCAENPNCDVIVIHPNAMAYDMIPQEQVSWAGDYLAQEILDAEARIKQNGWLGFKSYVQTTKPYKVLNFFFQIDQFDKGFSQYLESLNDNVLVFADYVRSGGRLKYIPTLGFIPYGGNPKILLQLNLRDYIEGNSRMLLSVLGAVGGYNLLKGFGRGVAQSIKLLWFKDSVRKFAVDGGRLSYTNRGVLAKKAAELGETKLAFGLHRATRIKTAEDLINVAIGRNMWPTAKWAALTTLAKTTGVSLPAYPSSVSGVELAKFIFTQGALIITDQDSNLTTKGLELTGKKATDFLGSLASKWAVNHPNGTTEEFVSQTFRVVGAKLGSSVTVDNAGEMTDEEVAELLKVKYEPHINKLVVGAFQDVSNP